MLASQLVARTRVVIHGEVAVRWTLALVFFEAPAAQDVGVVVAGVGASTGCFLGQRRALMGGPDVVLVAESHVSSEHLAVAAVRGLGWAFWAGRTSAIQSLRDSSSSSKGRRQKPLAGKVWKLVAVEWEQSPRDWGLLVGLSYLPGRGMFRSPT